MKKIIYLLILVNNVVLSQQFNDYHFMLNNSEVDSIMLSSLYFYSKEMGINHTLLPHSTIKKDSLSNSRFSEKKILRDTIYTKNSVVLRNRERRKLIKKIDKFNSDFALQGHYDIQLDFYKKGQIKQTITISSLTKNIEIRKRDCEKVYMKDFGEKRDPCWFQGQVSEDLKKYITKILHKHKLWNKEQLFFEDL